MAPIGLRGSDMHETQYQSGWNASTITSLQYIQKPFVLPPKLNGSYTIELLLILSFVTIASFLLRVYSIVFELFTSTRC